jgi:ligand-binding sensor domain-containing protein/serine phosphatase RsbU (regulator of sigma subunit)
LKLRTLLKIFFSFLLLFTAGIAVAQTYDFRNFNVDEGLAQSQVLSMCQDRNGNIWFGTNSGGASRYDGNKFVTFTENDSLINNVIYSITELKNGRILFGTNGGLSVYNGIKFKNYTEKDGLPHNRVFKTVEDNNGLVWIATANGVCRMINDKIVAFTDDTLLSQAIIITMYADKAGNIWFGTVNDGITKYDPSKKTFTRFTTENGLRNNFVRAINEDLQGNVYVGTISGISRITTDNKVQKVNIPNEDVNAFLAIISDNRNNLWFGTSAGVYKYNGFAYRNYLQKNGLASNKVLSVLQDREGNFWFGTDGFGVSKFSTEAFTSYSVKDSLPGDYITTIFQDSKKHIWLGVKNFGVCKFDNGKIINYRLNVKNTSGSLADNEVLSICEDYHGNIYFGTKSGLSVFNGSTFTNYHKKDGLPDEVVYSIIRDHSGTIWIGTQNELCSFKDGKFTVVPQVSALKANEESKIFIYSIYEDRNHDLWLATEHGVIHYDRKTAVRVNRGNGFTDKRVTCILEDNTRYLLFGTDDGLFSYDRSAFKNINEGKGIASNKIYLMLLEKNYLWIGTNKGLDRINLNEFHKKDVVEIRHFGKEEGLKGVECNSNACFKDADNNLWFGTIKGTTVFNPQYDKINRKETITRITGIRLFFQNAEDDLEKYSDGTDSVTHLPVNLVLPYDKNHVTFDFIGICITNPNKVKYQFRLEGADEDWYPPTSKTEATYSSLSAGDYTFHLKAMNNDGIWNEKDVTFRFTILPPWYKTWWFYTLVGVLAFGSIYLFIVVRTRNLQKAKIDLEQEVQLRTFQLRQEKEKVEIINKEVIEQKAIIEAKNHDITDSIKYAKNIQEALLPPLQNLHNELKDAFVLYLPKDIVSGDFYWFAKRNNKRFVASVDCTGHGVPGAFMSIIGNTLLNEIVSEKNITEPAEILNELHAGVKTALKQNNSENERRDGMDIALCSLNEDGTVLEYAGANRPLWIFRKSKQGEEAFEMIKADKFPIGGLEMENEVKRRFTNHSIKVEKGDIVYIFSDGYADQFGGTKGKKFMVGNMQKFVAGIYQEPVKKQEELLLKNFLDWKGDLEQIDDVLVIGFRV